MPRKPASDASILGPGSGKRQSKRPDQKSTSQSLITGIFIDIIVKQLHRKNLTLYYHRKTTSS